MTAQAGSGQPASASWVPARRAWLCPTGMHDWHVLGCVPTWGTVGRGELSHWNLTQVSLSDTGSVGSTWPLCPRCCCTEAGIEHAVSMPMCGRPGQVKDACHPSWPFEKASFKVVSVAVVQEQLARGGWGYLLSTSERLLAVLVLREHEKSTRACCLELIFLWR